MILTLLFVCNINCSCNINSICNCYFRVQGGGFKELDDAELEEARRRRQQYKQGAEDDEE